jgi:hypothetical protein
MGCTDLNTIGSPPKSININKKDNIILAKGRWKALSETKAKLISKINTTAIACDHKNMTCKELASFVFTPKELPLSKNNQLYSQESIYPIIDWTDDIIKAKKEGPAVDTEIIISLKDNFAEKNFLEPKVVGNETPNLDVYGKWILE